MNNTEIDIPQMVGLKPIEKSLSDQEGKPDCCASENNHASKQTATIQDTCVPERDTCSPPLSLLPTSPPVVSSSPPVVEDDIPLNESITKTNSDVPIKVFYSSLVEALNTKKGLPAINNEECFDNDMLSESEGLTSKPTKVSSTSKKISRTRKSKNLAEVQKSKPVLNSEKIISDIITSCDRHIFGQTSSIQTILNTCSQIMSIAGCEKFGNDIMDVCSQILSDAYKNGQNIIDLCKRLSKWQSKVDVMQETTSKMKKTNRKTAKKNGIISKSKPIVKVEVEEDVALDELPLISDSEDELNQVDDPDWTSYWAKKNNANPQVNDDQDDGNDSLRKKGQMTENDTEWVPEPEEETKSKPSKKCNKSGKKRSTPIRGEFKCFQCPRVFPTLKGFQNHLECHKKVTCEICNLVYTKPHLKRHMMVHTGEKPFICDICGSGFADVTSMKDHQHVHSDVKKIQCELCDYRCKTVKRLRMHKVRHSTERKFQCDNCGARFLRNSDLKKHLLVHKDTFPFACANCSKRFKDKMHLRRHEETHTDQYKFQCPFCGKRMRQSGNLKTHLRTHNGEKPYKCEKCGQGFAHNVTKKQHQEQCRSGLGIEILIP